MIKPRHWNILTVNYLQQPFAWRIGWLFSRTEQFFISLVAVTITGDIVAN
jgi:hypothetical protein